MSRERAGQVVLCILIIGIIYIGSCLPWWSFFIGHSLLLGTVMIGVLCWFIIGLGNLQDRIEGVEN